MQPYHCFAILYTSQTTGEVNIYFFQSSEERESYLNFLVGSPSWNIIGCTDVVPVEFQGTYEEYILSQEMDSWE